MGILKEWTKYRGVFFTIIAFLQGFHLIFELFAVAKGTVFDAGTIVVNCIYGRISVVNRFSSFG